MHVKRIALFCLALLLAAALALPWWIGRDAEARYRDMVIGQAEGAAPFTLRLEEFRRGWFTSRARVSVTAAGGPAEAVIEALGGTPGAGGLVLTDRIAHGLLPFQGAGERMSWRPALAAVNGRLHEAGGAGTLARVSYRIGLDGGLALALTAPGGGDAAPQASRNLAWRDLRVDASIPAGPGKAVLDIAAAALEVPRGAGRLVAKGLQGRLEARLPESGLPSGRIEVSARETALAGPDRLGGAEDLVLEAEFDADGDTAGGTVQGSIGRVGSPRETYGPGEFRMTLDGLDSKTLGRVFDSLARVADRGLRGRAGAMALAGVLLAEAPSLLAHGPVLELHHLELDTRDGPLSARGRLDLDSAKPVVLKNPYLLQRAVRGRLEVTVPPVAARHAALIHLRMNGRLGSTSPDAWLDEQVGRGRLGRDDAGYRISIRLARGQVSVNGRPWGELWP